MIFAIILGVFIILFTCFTCYVVTRFLLDICNSSRPTIILINMGIIASMTLLIIAFVDCSKVNIDAITIYNAGNVEISGKTCLFKKQDDERFSFSDYKVEKGPENAYERYDEVITITLTDDYYKQYMETIKDQKSMTIEIKK